MNNDVFMANGCEVEGTDTDYYFHLKHYHKPIDDLLMSHFFEREEEKRNERQSIKNA